MNETTYEIVGRLFEKIFDGRRIKENRKVIIFSPVGNHAELELFSKYIKKIGLDKKNEVDFLFIYRKGLEKLDVGLSAIHATEKYPIGTSGSFFAGQATCYSLGYEYIIVTDCDALIDSLETFEDEV
ncbi:hypothetical protein KJ780_00815, partial [Candidatus Micrarchaeota archaeon]|nr:hypothetical protein [Candidatus Micrarchaeota archaeon]